MYAIPVTPFTLDLIAALSGGARPVMREEPTYFLVVPEKNFTMIVDEESYKDMTHDKKAITISYLS